MFYLTTHSNTFYLRLYGIRHMIRTTQIAKEETRCRHIGYSFQLAAMVLLYVSSNRQDNTYNSLCYTSRGALAGTRNSSKGPPHEGSIRWPIAPWANALTAELHLAAQLSYTYLHSLAWQYWRKTPESQLQVRFGRLPPVLPCQTVQVRVGWMGSEM